MASKPTQAPAPKAAATNLPVAVPDYSQFEGQGFERQGRDDLTIPFLGLLQPLSPQLETIPNAKVGMLFNSVTLELYPQGVLFVPSITQHVFVEWKPRTAGGGMVAVHPVDASVVMQAKKEGEFGKYKTPDGNELVETFYMAGVLCDDKDAIGPAMIAFNSTKIKVYKRINTRLNTFMVPRPGGGKYQPPIFAHLLRVKCSEKQKNNKGEFYNFDIDSAAEDLMKGLLNPSDPRFQAAMEVKWLVESGIVKADYANDRQDDDDGDGKVPF